MDDDPDLPPETDTDDEYSGPAWPRWASTFVSARTTRRDLLSLLKEAQAWYRDHALYAAEVAKKYGAVEAAYLEKAALRHPPKSPPKPATKKRTTAGNLNPEGVTAAEANEFLRSLPPVPLWGDDA